MPKGTSSRKQSNMYRKLLKMKKENKNLRDKILLYREMGKNKSRVIAA